MTFRKEGNTSSVPHIKQFDFSELIEVQQNASRVLRKSEERINNQMKGQIQR